ncbi:MAG: hypothetical protein JWR19_4047 [Pedosphaera sp.]|nr:hypothetical protein [Pedosphaera sp.]
MSDLEYLKKDFLLEIGRIAALRGSLRHLLLSAGDQLLSTRLGDQGIARLMMSKRELPDICQALLTLAQVRGVASDAVQQLAQVATEYRADFESAAAVANGSWTYLGDEKGRHYGLFLEEVARDGDLQPQWQHMTMVDMQRLSQRLKSASETVRPLIWAMIAAADSRGRKQ